MLVLVVLIFRAVTLEFRSQQTSPRWRTAWDWSFSLSSLVLALLLGVAFGAVISGVPLGADQEIRTNLLELLTPFNLLVGVTTVAMFAMHGAIYLIMKTEDDLQARIKRFLPYLMIGFVVLNTLWSSSSRWRSSCPSRSATSSRSGRSIFPAAALAGHGRRVVLRAAARATSWPSWPRR